MTESREAVTFLREQATRFHRATTLVERGAIERSVLRKHGTDEWETALRETHPGHEVTFKGGPWDEQKWTVERVVGPVFAVCHAIGGHYWLDSKSDPPTYHWDGGHA